jgi:hypothetical protein
MRMVWTQPWKCNLFGTHGKNWVVLLLLLLLTTVLVLGLVLVLVLVLVGRLAVILVAWHLGQPSWQIETHSETSLIISIPVLLLLLLLLLLQ